MLHDDDVMVPVQMWQVPGSDTGGDGNSELPTAGAEQVLTEQAQVVLQEPKVQPTWVGSPLPDMQEWYT